MLLGGKRVNWRPGLRISSSLSPGMVDEVEARRFSVR